MDMIFMFRSLKKAGIDISQHSDGLIAKAFNTALACENIPLAIKIASHSKELATNTFSRLWNSSQYKEAHQVATGILTNQLFNPDNMIPGKLNEGEYLAWQEREQATLRERTRQVLDERCQEENDIEPKELWSLFYEKTNMLPRNDFKSR